MNETINIANVAVNQELRDAALYCFLIFIVFPVVSIFGLTFIKEYEAKEDKAYKDFKLSESVLNKFKVKYPGITDFEIDLVWKSLSSFLSLVAKDNQERATKYFFKPKPKVFSMTSVIVDDLWHEFILDTKNYVNYCKRFCGGYIHHHPGTVTFETDFRNKRVDDAVIETLKELLQTMDDEKHINGIPLMFVIDEQLQLKNGFRFNFKNLCIQMNEEKEQEEKRRALLC